MKLSAYRILTPLLLIALLLAGCTAPNATAPASPTLPAATLPAATLPPATLPPATATTDAGPASPTATAAASSEIPQTAGGVQYVIVPEQSEARYRIREQLVNLDLPNDAVGSTKEVAGSITVNADGSIDPAASKLTVNMASITSDRSNRDNYVRRNVLNTDQYPTAEFVPTQVTGLPSPLPESGEVSFQVTGDLTLLNVTQSVTWNVTGTVDGDQAVGQATTSFPFTLFNLNKPSVPVVLSVDDEIKLEVDVTLRRQAAPTASSESIPATGESSAAAADAPVCSSPAVLTPAMTEGPYYKSGPPQASNLVQEGMSGTQLTLTGFVLTADCRPVPNARVDFWQADGQGVYDNSGYTLRGYQLTDANGRYQLVTVIPGEYPGRTEHIHVKVQAPGGPELTSQLFFPDVSANQVDRIFDNSLLVNDFADGAGGKTATFNFIVSTGQ